MNNEIIEARFIDEGHLNVSVISKNSDGELVEDIIQADPTQNQYKELLKHTTEEEIFERTAEWKLESKRAFDNYIEPLVSQLLEKKYDSIVNELDAKKEEAKIETKEEDITITPEMLFNMIMENNKNEEVLFKIKLEIFNLDQVKKSKNKKLKTDIRKAKSITEVLSFIK